MANDDTSDDMSAAGAVGTIFGGIAAPFSLAYAGAWHLGGYTTEQSFHIATATTVDSLLGSTVLGIAAWLLTRHVGATMAVSLISMVGGGLLGFGAASKEFSKPRPQTTQKLFQQELPTGPVRFEKSGSKTYAILNPSALKAT